MIIPAGVETMRCFFLIVQEVSKNISRRGAKNAKKDE